MCAADIHSVSAIGGSAVRAVIVRVRAKAFQLNAPHGSGKVRPHTLCGPVRARIPNLTKWRARDHLAQLAAAAGCARIFRPRSFL